MKTVAAWLYGLQCFLVVPGFLGAFYRHEMSSSPWKEFTKQAHLHGTGDALFGLYLYAVFYSLPVVLAWVYLPPYVRREFRVLLSAWAGYTFFVFLPALLQVVGSGWLFGVWVAFSVLVAAVTMQLVKEVRGPSGP